MRYLLLIYLLLSGCLAVDPGGSRGQISSAYNLPAETVLTRIAFGSCLVETRAQPILRQVAALKPDLFVMMGDNVYADNYQGKWLQEPNAEAVRYAYDLQRRNEDFKKFTATGIPLLATWDDHDYGLNDAGAELPLDHKNYAKTALLDFFSVPRNAPVRQRDGLYQSLTFGPKGQRVQIILLDTRWFRSALSVTDKRGARGKERYLQDWSANKTMLGEAQWQWLAAALRQPADLRLVVTSIQLMAEAHGYERWGNLPLERDRFYELVLETGANNVVLLSGDRHMGGFYHRFLAENTAIYEATSSSLNRGFTLWSDERGPFQMGPMVGPANFGLLEIDWASGTIGIKLIGEDGDILRRIAVEWPVQQPKSS